MSALLIAIDIILWVFIIIFAVLSFFSIALRVRYSIVVTFIVLIILEKEKAKGFGK